MELFLGIDLGSTTSKAVLLDAAGAVVGRGLTNTRNNYGAAAAIARDEAEIDARFVWLAASLPDGTVRQLERAFRIVQMGSRLSALRERIEALSAALEDRASATEALEIARAMDERPEEVLGAGPVERSRFFRDVVGDHWRRRVEEAAAAGRSSFELVQGLFDRAILEVENRAEEPTFDELVGPAVRRAGLDRGAEEATASALRSLGEEGLRIRDLVGTGYGRQRLPFAKEQIRSEILCHGLGAHFLFPQTRTVIDIGGQDTKAIQIDERGLVTSFQMNDRCAAGCGRYLGYIADELNIGLHELGPLALTATRAVRISSTCTVFAGIELRELLAAGERRENILLGLHRSILVRAMGLLARSGGVNEQLTFTGGVANNPAAVHLLRELVAQSWGERTINLHPDSIFTGAIGAALFARRGSEA